MNVTLTRRGEGVKKSENLADVIYGRPLRVLLLTNVEAILRLMSLRFLSVISQFLRPPKPPPLPRGAMNPNPVHLEPIV